MYIIRCSVVPFRRI